VRHSPIRKKIKKVNEMLIEVIKDEEVPSESF
jgi:uncharacterized protein (UPF0147 family)